MNDRLQAKLDMLPSLPGVYKMLDKDGTIIYVGKAVSLRNRVRQYFQSNKNHNSKVRAMVSHIEDLETIVVGNETEALTLESNLIKEFMPKYNILLKDDKHFPYVCINVKQDFPRLEVVRRIKDNGCTYLGPYLSGQLLGNDLKIVRDTFPIRHCKKNIEAAIARKERPCLMYQVGKCCAPCSGKVTREQYHSYINDVIRYLNGHTEDVLKHLREQMLAASNSLDFEEAAAIRDRIRAIESISEKQVAISTAEFDADAFAIAKNELATIVYAVFVRGGKIIGTDKFPMQTEDDDSDASILTAFLSQYYLNTNTVPRDVLLSIAIDDAEVLEQWLGELAHRRVYISVPKRGEKAKLTAMAQSNGDAEVQKTATLQKREWDKGGGALLRLQEILNIQKPLVRMECFDNSHTMGILTVSSMVVFTDGKPDKMQYRRFRLESDTHGDDLLAMHEVLMRRFAHGEPYPDLLIIDGGKEQLKVARAVLESLQLNDISVIGLAETREVIYTPNSDEPIVLAAREPALHVLQYIRDEAHRFAISYHRQLQQKKMLYSQLDDIPQIGDKRKRALFESFLTLDAIIAASVEELVAVPTISKTAAESIYRHFHSQS